MKTLAPLLCVALLFGTTHVFAAPSNHPNQPESGETYVAEKEKKEATYHINGNSFTGKETLTFKGREYVVEVKGTLEGKTADGTFHIKDEERRLQASGSFAHTPFIVNQDTGEIRVSPLKQVKQILSDDSNFTPIPENTCSRCFTGPDGTTWVRFVFGTIVIEVPLSALSPATVGQLINS
ncbi:hypothetical protein ACFYKX_10155 [Cytobacillus sp. FJAT-54145]|uniref:Uncharacterized protein n=1 Tax=Cytobacillus spartinae TaxID=3299023 RepID=A0ABW6K9T4_9BACI